VEVRLRKEISRCCQAQPSIAVTSPLRHANVKASGHLSFPSLDFWDPQSSKLADIVEEACTMLSSILHTSLPTYHGSLSCLAILLAHHLGREDVCSHAYSACAAMHNLSQQSSMMYTAAMCNVVLQVGTISPLLRQQPTWFDALLCLQARLTMIGS